MEDLEKSCDILIDMLSEEPKSDFKWVDFRLWYWLHGEGMAETMSKDEIISKWKSISVYSEKELSDEFVEELKHVIDAIDSYDSVE